MANIKYYQGAFNVKNLPAKNRSQIIIYQAEDGQTKIEGSYQNIQPVRNSYGFIEHQILHDNLIPHQEYERKWS